MTKKHYDARILTNFILRSTPGIRKSQEYKKQRDQIIDETMSCDRKEAIEWMDHYMGQAIAAGKGRRDDRIRTRFLAAYDLQTELANIKN